MPGPFDCTITDRKFRDPVGQQPFRPLRQNGRQSPFAGGEQHLALSQTRVGINRETEAVETANPFTLHGYGSILFKRYGQGGPILSERFHKYCRPPIDEAFGKACMQRIRKFRLNRACARSHFVAGQNPVGPLADISPGSDRGYHSLQSIDVTLHPIQLGNACSNEIGAQIAFAQVLPKSCDETGMGIHPNLTKIGERTGLPEPPDTASATHAVRQGLAGQPLQNGKVDRFGCAAQHFVFGPGFKIAYQRFNGIEARFGLTPVQMG